MWCVAVAEAVTLPLAAYLSFVAFAMTGHFDIGDTNVAELFALIHVIFIPPIFVSMLLGYCLFHFHGKRRAAET
jgi:hypothetical protein